MLKRAYTGHRLAVTWFLKLFCVHICMHVCVCVYAPQRQLIFSGIMWHDMAWSVSQLYMYLLMVNSESCCCLCGRWIFSNPVTFSYYSISLYHRFIIPKYISMVKHNVTGTNHCPDAYLIMLVFRCIVTMFTQRSKDTGRFQPQKHVSPSVQA